MLRLILSILRSMVRAIKNDPEVTRVILKHPIVSGFIKRRLTHDEVFGLHLTIGVLCSLLAIIFSFGAFRDIIGEASVNDSDIRMLSAVQILQSSQFTESMIFFTNFGKWEVIVAGVAGVSVLLYLVRRWYYLIGLLVSVGVGELFVLLIKELIERPRPELVNILSSEWGYSFPSGHVFVAISFYGLLAYYAILAVKNIFFRVTVVFLVSALILLVGFSRVYLGVHWPSDVFASLFSGAAWLSILMTILEMRRMANHQPHLPRVPRRLLALLALLFFSIWAWIFFIYFQRYTIVPVSSPSVQDQVLPSDEIPQTFFMRMPRYSETVLGTLTEPINIVIVGSEDAMIEMIEDAGWVLSDQLSLSSFGRAMWATVRDAPYLDAPGTPTFWNTRPNDFSFAKPTASHSVRERHHLHIWRSPFITERGRVFVGTAHFDTGIKFRSPLIIPIHTTDPAIDKERELVKNDIEGTDFVEQMTRFQIVEPALGRTIGGDQFFTDGYLYTFFMKESYQ